MTSNECGHNDTALVDGRTVLCLECGTAFLGDRPSMGRWDCIDERLHEYARLLAGAGFTIYAPTDTQRPLEFFHYSREVDGQTLYGTALLPNFPSLGQSIEHHMSIKPSREHGASMWIDSDQAPESIAIAMEITRPTNTNRLVGTHKNHEPWGIGTHYLPVAD